MSQVRNLPRIARYPRRSLRDGASPPVVRLSVLLIADETDDRTTRSSAYLSRARSAQLEGRCSSAGCVRGHVCDACSAWAAGSQCAGAGAGVSHTFLSYSAAPWSHFRLRVGWHRSRFGPNCSASVVEPTTTPAKRCCARGRRQAHMPRARARGSCTSCQEVTPGGSTVMSIKLVYTELEYEFNLN